MIEPSVRVITQLSRQPTRIVHVPGTRIVGRERKPETLRDGQFGRESITQPVQVLDTAADVMRRINRVLDTHFLGRTRHQLHQTTRTHRRTRLRIKSTLLVHLRRYQPPIKTVSIRVATHQVVVG